IASRWGHGDCPRRQVADVASHSTHSAGVEIYLVRHRLDTKNFLTVNNVWKVWRGSAVGSRAGYFPDPSLACGAVTCPKVAVAFKSHSVGSGSPSGEDRGGGQILGTGVEEINGCRGAIGDVEIAPSIERNAKEATVPTGGDDSSDFNQLGVVQVDLPNRAG